MHLDVSCCFIELPYSHLMYVCIYVRVFGAEREKAEMERITGKKSMDTGIDWMYQGTAEVKAEQEKQLAEEYLLGKEITSSGILPKGDFEAEVSATRREEELFLKQNHSRGDLDGHGADDLAGKPRDMNEEFVKRHEDPMYLIAQKKKERSNEMLKKSSLLEKVMKSGRQVNSRSNNENGRYQRDDSPRYDKSDRKRSKKKKKHHRRRSRSRSRSRDRESYHRRDRRARSKSMEPNRDRRIKEDKGDKHYRDRSIETGRDTRHLNRRVERTSKHGYRDYNHDIRVQDGHREKNSKYREASNDGSNKEHPSSQDRLWGLQGVSSKMYTPSVDVGPDSKLLESRRKEKLSKRTRIKDRKREMTREEKESALREMQSSAYKRDKDIEESILRNETLKVENEQKISGNAMFLNDMVDKASNISMRDRINARRHTNQRSADMQSFV